MSVYVTLAELKPQPGCEVDPNEFAGAMVRAYAAAGKLTDAIDRFESALAELKFAVVDYEYIGRTDVIDFAYTEGDAEPDGRDLANEAKTSGKVIFGEFQVWEQDDEA